MVRPADQRKATARLVELKGVQPAFPLYGELTLQIGAAVHATACWPTAACWSGRNCSRSSTSPSVTRCSSAARGSRSAASSRRSPAGARAASASVRGCSWTSQISSARGCSVFGSRATYALNLKMPEAAVAPLAKDLRDRYRGQFVRVRTFQATENDIGRELERTENYLSLVGPRDGRPGRRRRLERRPRVPAAEAEDGRRAEVPRAPPARRFSRPTSCRSSDCRWPAARSASAWRGSRSPASSRRSSGDRRGRRVALTPPAVAQGVGVGLLVALLFALVPLLEVRNVRAALLLRESAAARPTRDWLSYLATAVVGGGLVALAVWQAGSWRVGAILAGGFAGDGPGAARRGAGAGEGDGAAAAEPLVRAALRRAADRPAGQPGEARAAGRRAGCLPRARRPAAAGEPVRGVPDHGPARHAGHVPDRRPAGPGRRREGVPREARLRPPRRVRD